MRDAIALQKKQQNVSGVRSSFCESLEYTVNVWFADGLRPIYNANKMVSFLGNTLTPPVNELVVDEHKLDNLYDAAINDQDGFSRRTQRLEEILSRVRVSCDTVDERQVSEQFLRFRDATRAFSTDAQCVHCLRMLYVSHGLARKILSLVIGRLVESLEKYCDIVSTTDIPMEALMLGK